MEITVPENKLRAALESEAKCKKRFGAEMTKKIFTRLGSLKAADSLMTFWPPKSGPERCHELVGDMAGLFSMDVKQPYRLLFKPSDVALKSNYTNDQEYWEAIVSIEISRIEDTHG
jgi:plasmid maintenance system killer protein